MNLEPSSPESMTSQQKQAHARILAACTVRTHLKKPPIERGQAIRGRMFKEQSEAGTKGRWKSSLYGGSKPLK